MGENIHTRPSEKEFFSVTGMRYGADVDVYRSQLAVANEIPDEIIMHTGHTAKEVKKFLTEYIKSLGGSTEVGDVSDWFKFTK